MLTVLRADGEHTDEILRALGYDDAAIQAIRERHVIAWTAGTDFRLTTVR